MVKNIFGTITVIALFLTGCQSEKPTKETKVPWVKTFIVQPQSDTERVLSGTVRARHEMPMAFRINGRIEQRAVDAGQQVKKGQLLFALDPSDLEKELDARRAEVSAAKSAISLATADVVRGRDLLKKKFISQQSLDRFILVKREAQERLNAAFARLEQAKNALSYANLKAESDGLLTEVTGERGGVIAAGQTVAVLAKEGELEVELFFPEELKPPVNGQVILRNGELLPLNLREVAGAADPVSHTWRSRYSVVSDSHKLALGNIVRAAFKQPGQTIETLEVPLASLDERGDTPRIWRIINGQAQPLAVEVTGLRTETALILANLPAGSAIISLGTHLLHPGMLVKPLKQ
jgi:RND family efflux transporter MFP subunit